MTSTDLKPADLKATKQLLEHITLDVEGKYHSIPVSNSKALRAFLNENADVALVAEYMRGEEVVRTGEIADKRLRERKEFNYAKVPLGLILKGSLIVVKGGKAVKTLGEGDFIGLFETSDWLQTQHTRQIGEWTLTADEDTEVMYFNASALSNHDPITSDFRTYLIELARADHVPQPLTSLPLLDWVASHTTRSRLSDCAIVIHTHLLPNNAPFFRHLSHLVSPGRTFILEKPYSTVRSVFNDLVRSGYDLTQIRMEEGMPYEFSARKGTDILWRKVLEAQKKEGFKKLLIVSDGGDLWLSFPWQDFEGVQVAGVEQTQRGITRIEGSSLRTPPVVSVASSGIKKLVESRFIGRSVVLKLKELGALDEAKSIGVIGTGSIGMATIETLKELGYSALSYDASHRPGDASEGTIASLDTLLNRSDLIIGTTGVDVLTGIAFERVSGKKVLASASSSDIEFGTLLKLADPTEDAFGTRHAIIHDTLEVSILNGGYPINFDRVKDSTPDEDIVLTRCLLYVAAMQAATFLASGKHKPGIYDLDKVSQKRMLEQWIEDKWARQQDPGITKEEVDDIVSYSSLKNAKTMQTVWRD